MLFQPRTQDLLMQNQSMRLVENTLEQNNAYVVQVAKVRYMQSVLPTPIIGTAGVVIMFYFMGQALDLTTEMTVWLFLGLLSTLWRLYMLMTYKDLLESTPSASMIRNYLRQISLTSMIAGMTFGWGWLRDRKSTRLNSSHVSESRMPSSA